MCVCVCVCTCMRACVCECERAHLHACVYTCACMCCGCARIELCTRAQASRQAQTCVDCIGLRSSDWKLSSGMPKLNTEVSWLALLQARAASTARSRMISALVPACIAVPSSACLPCWAQHRQRCGSFSKAVDAGGCSIWWESPVRRLWQPSKSTADTIQGASGATILEYSFCKPQARMGRAQHAGGQSAPRTLSTWRSIGSNHTHTHTQVTWCAIGSTHT